MLENTRGGTESHMQVLSFKSQVTVVRKSQVSSENSNISESSDTKVILHFNCTLQQHRSKVILTEQENKFKFIQSNPTFLEKHFKTTTVDQSAVQKK